MSGRRHPRPAGRAGARRKVVAAGCGQGPWEVGPPVRADVEVLRVLGQELADWRAAIPVPLVGDLEGRRARAGAERAELAICDLLRGAAA